MNLESSATELIYKLAWWIEEASQIGLAIIQTERI